MGKAGFGGAGDIEVFLADLARWSADSRASDAAASRIRERWLRQAAVEDARFAGMLLDLAEQGAGVNVRTTAGRTLQGKIATVAADFCVVRHDGGMATLVSFRAVATVRPEPGYRSGEADSFRHPPQALDLAGVLARLAAERPRVRIIVEGGGEALAGELRSVGADVATVRVDGDPPGMLYLQLDSVREVTLLN